jgi:GNAT superfamily N-acetyltransferase
MPWLVQYVADWYISCQSTHSQEAMAKVDTGRHLASLIELLASQRRELVRQGYGRTAGFLEAVDDVLEAVGKNLSQDKVWPAYDAWSAFMERWDGTFDAPIWVWLGDVIVKGPGPKHQRPLHALLPGRIRKKTSLGAAEPSSGEISREDLRISWKGPDGRGNHRVTHLWVEHPDTNSELEALFATRGDLADEIEAQDEATAECIRDLKDDPVGWIQNLKVTGDARGTGLGTRMVAAALETMRDQGVRSVWLIAIPEEGRGRMADLLRFYGRHGFKIATGCHGRGHLTLTVRL